MVEKEFFFRGKTVEELMKMGTEEFAKLCTTRSRRSLLRNKDKIFEKTLDLARKKLGNVKDYKPIRTHNRDAIVTPKMIGLKLGVYNGHEFTAVEVRQEMLGHCLGEFALTRKKIRHGKAGIGATKSSTAITAR